MSWEGICQGWADDLVREVPLPASSRIHLYAPWSPELFHAAVGETHVAVFPLGDGMESVAPLATGMLPTDLITTLFEADVWVGAAAEDSRLVEDQAADLAWLQLAQDVRARFYVQANGRIGEPHAMDTRYRGSRVGTINGCRFLSVSFAVRWSLAFT